MAASDDDAGTAADDLLATVHLPEAHLTRLAPLFQQGLRVRAAAGVSVRDFLVEGLGVDAGYVRERITTVFLNGSVVDDMDTARLHEGARLALSAAMPGLVGATLRKGGYYAAMRAAITLAAEREPTTAGGSLVRVQVKLFNLLIEELGPLLLAGGFALTPAEAAELLGDLATGIRGGEPDVWLRVLAR
jgi:hypothetical protein